MVRILRNDEVSHFVNYRKQVSPSMADLLPEADFRLFAVSVRFPQGLARRYRLEVTTMPDMLEQLVRETIEEILRELPAEERLKGLPAEELRKHLSPEQRLEGLSVDDLLAALPAETRATLAQRLKGNSSPGNPG